jgi:hypothetical protein
MMLERKVKSRNLCSSPQREAATNIVLAVYVCSTRHCTLTGPDVRYRSEGKLKMEFPASSEQP